MPDVVQLTSDLVRFPSVSDQSNAECAAFLCQRLEELAFDVETTSYQDSAGTRKVNVIGRRGPGSGGLAYLAHNDVVPATDWIKDPFSPYETDGRLFGRGSCDMKGSLAAMLCAAERVDLSHQTKPLWIGVTADEEIGFQGAKHLVSHSDRYRQIVAQQPAVIIGEPTSLSVVHAHKGIACIEITSQGRAAHSSTRDGENAVLAMIPMLTELEEIHWRTETAASLLDNRFDPPTLSWNVGIRGDETAINVTPARCSVWVSFRSMPAVDGKDLVAQVRDRADQLGLSVKFIEGSGPVWVEPDDPFVQQMLELTGTGKPKTVCYGTDGGILTDLKHMVICGPGDIAQAHTVDEWIDISQLHRGVDVYERTIRRLCCQQ